jgi:hypothetical protein
MVWKLICWLILKLGGDKIVFVSSEALNYMGNTVAGFELVEGVSITDLDLWPSFAEWWEGQHGCEPMSEDSKCRELFEAYLAGAHYQWQRSRW